VLCGEGRLGFKDEGPYDLIHIGASAPNYVDLRD